MFNTLKKIFAKKSETKTLRMRFDAAQTTADNRRHWAMANGDSADKEADPAVRKTLRQRARYEVANNSYAKGLVQMLANDTIGTGPRLQVFSENGDRIESDFMQWASAVKLTNKLRTMRIARCQDGEAFAVLSSNPQLVSDVKLNFTVIESDRIESELSFTDNGLTVDGIQFDQYGNPVKYRMLKNHPGSDSISDDAEYISAENMIHIFRQDRPGLHRGIPEITPALPLFAQLRRYNLAVLSAAEAAADFAAILYTDAPPDGETADVAPLDSVQLQRNMMVTVPAGWKMAQLEAKHPTSNHAEFVKVILSEIARSVCSTYGAVAGDFSGFNYASGRLDNQIYQKSVLVDRKFWESEVLNPLFYSWYREYAITRKISAEPPKFTWFWDAFLHVDPSKEANAQAVHLANHTTTLAFEYAKQGLDWRTELQQRAKELALMKELGIPFNTDNIKEETQNTTETEENQ